MTDAVTDPVTDPAGSSVPFTVVKGRPDDTETAAIGRALALVVAEAATSTAAADPRDVARHRARTTSRGLFGSPAEQLARPRNFNPTGFRG
ncbi:acyl-CoA carboxylase epsilon subunit [Corynebacterium sp. USCH3]|uniref:acyl-CoA carboxylase subunit epsilon n=1 Tax=Corynebacterium sp. USCH3 TaxID=3024840 RepID=UPI0030B3BDE0